MIDTWENLIKAIAGHDPGIDGMPPEDEEVLVRFSGEDENGSTKYEGEYGLATWASEGKEAYVWEMKWPDCRRFCIEKWWRLPREL